MGAKKFVFLEEKFRTGSSSKKGLGREGGVIPKYRS